MIEDKKFDKSDKWRQNNQKGEAKKEILRSLHCYAGLKIKEAFSTMIMSREEALEDQKKRYGTPGDPLYMAGIQTIKKHYKNV